MPPPLRFAWNDELLREVKTGITHAIAIRTSSVSPTMGARAVEEIGSGGLMDASISIILTQGNSRLVGCNVDRTPGVPHSIIDYEATSRAESVGANEA